jgi:hypothetical protein
MGAGCLGTEVSVAGDDGIVMTWEGISTGCGEFEGTSCIGLACDGADGISPDPAYGVHHGQLK